MTKSDRARAMKAAHPELNGCQIAAAIGMDRSHAYDALRRKCVPRLPRAASPRIRLVLTARLAEAVHEEARRSRRARAAVVRDAVRLWALSRERVA